MPIAEGASNLFFNRDTKVYLGQSQGRPINVSATLIASNTVTTALAHGLSNGDRVMVTVGTGVTGLSSTVATILYAIVISTTTLKFAASYADAIAATPVPITITGTPSAGYYIAALDSYVTPTAVTLNGTTASFTATHNFQAGDLVSVYGVTDTGSLSLNGVYLVASITSTTAFTVASAATGTISTPSSIKVVKTNMWEVPVLAGYSASQGTATSEITLNEMTSAAGISRRGRQMFNNAVNPTEWSFDTYVRPYKASNGNQYAIEEPLWANLIGRNAAVTSGSGSTLVTSWALGTTRGASNLDFGFSNSNSVNLGTFDLYYVLGGNKVASRNFVGGTDGGTTTIYKVSDAVVNECSISFDIEGISTISWGGMGSAMNELGAFNGTTAGTQGITASNNFIRNRLTAVSAVASSPTTTTYALTLTGGSITISNNITFLTPEVLGVVNKPIGHVTGTRTISGTFTCYLDEVANGSIDLFQDLLEKGLTTVTNQFALDFYVGGGGGNVPNPPGVQFSFPQAHLEIPSVTFDDVISTEVNWHALPTTISSADEISKVRYAGPAI
jgi:hypothetical protein